MFNLITNDQEIQTAIEKFQKRIKELAIESKTQEWVFPSGGQASYQTYTLNIKKGKIKVAFAGDWGSREAHLFTIETDEPKLTPNLEINIPYSSNANVAGVFLQENDRLALAHRGIINAFRGRIPKEITMEQFKDKVVSTASSSNVIFISYLDADDSIDKIASFVSSVSDFKEQYKNKNLDD